MIEEPVTFYSDELRLSGALYWPDDAEAQGARPLTVACSGFTGLRRIHPERFARYLTSHGLVCFGFDYRGFASSEGKPGRVLLEEQVRDIIHAVAYVSAESRVYQQKIFLLGWGMGAGLILEAARTIKEIAGLVAVNGFYNGARVQQAHRGEDGFREFCRIVADERRRRVRTGQAALVDPFDIYPLDSQSRKYVDNVLRKTPDYNAQQYSMELADSLLNWDPESTVRHLEIPLLIAHGSANCLHPPGEAQALHDAYRSPKELLWLEGAGHTEFMHDDNPTFQFLAGYICDWINEQLTS